MFDNFQQSASSFKKNEGNTLKDRILSKLEKFGEDDVMFKATSQMGLEDVMERMKIRTKEPDRLKREKMMREEIHHFERLYGNDPVSYDETGKMVQPKLKWIVQHNEKPQCPMGLTLDKSVDQLVSSLPQALPDDQNGSHLKRAVRGFQAGLNVLKPKTDQMQEALLKEDGLFGPKTVKRLKRNLLEQGAGKTAETIAIGQMKEILQKVRQNGLPDAAVRMRSVFSPLLPSSYNVQGSFQPEGLALQDTINDLKPDHLEDLKDDGVIGPKTREALSVVSKSTDDATFMKRFAHNIGFIDLDE